MGSTSAFRPTIDEQKEVPSRPSLRLFCTSDEETLDQELARCTPIGRSDRHRPQRPSCTSLSGRCDPQPRGSAFKDGMTGVRELVVDLDSEQACWRETPLVLIGLEFHLLAALIEQVGRA
jgi:hypothetical protein